jgi:sentrin-specific protease 1
MAGKLDAEDVTRVNTWRHGVGVAPDDVLGTAFNIRVTQAKFSCLRDGSWINDEIINLMMMILGAEYFTGARPSKIFTSFFFFNLEERDHGYNYSAVRRWTKYPHGDEFPCKQVGTARWLNIFLFEKVYIPINVSNTHWFLCILDMDKKVIRFIDSLDGPKSKYFTALCRWIDDERKKLDLDGDESAWRMELLDGPKQLNGIDCGVFTLAAAEIEMMNLPHLYDQSMMSWLRLRFGNDIITHCMN